MAFELDEAHEDFRASVRAFTDQRVAGTQAGVGAISQYVDLADPRHLEFDYLRRMRDLVEEIVLADQVGLDVFGLGEHHRPDYVVSAPAVILAAAAARTRRIRLTSAVTVLSSEDPVRVLQDYATLDLLSEGRAEIMAGRGSFIESFPLFGYALDDYESLFTEKLDLLVKLRADQGITWSGEHRAALTGEPVYPRSEQASLPIWVAVGGTPASASRAARLGLPMATVERRSALPRATRRFAIAIACVALLGVAACSSDTGKKADSTRTTTTVHPPWTAPGVH